jgi:hypothetical protein
MNFLIWNVRGLNHHSKHGEVFWGGFGYVGKNLTMKCWFWIRVSKVLIVPSSLLIAISIGFILLSTGPIEGWIDSIYGLICAL